MKRSLLVVAMCLSAAFATPSLAAPKSVSTFVNGGWVNETGIVFTGLTPTADPTVYSFTFSGGSIWDGDFTGHTVVQGAGFVNVLTGAFRGTYTETLYGTYLPDHRTGSLTTVGSVSTTPTLGFTAVARIVSGTCGFAGSKGRMRYDGTIVHGGYVGSWVHPRTTPAADPSCTPAPPPVP